MEHEVGRAAEGGWQVLTDGSVIFGEGDYEWDDEKVTWDGSQTLDRSDIIHDFFGLQGG